MQEKTQKHKRASFSWGGTKLHFETSGGFAPQTAFWLQAGECIYSQYEGVGRGLHSSQKSYGQNFTYIMHCMQNFTYIMHCMQNFTYIMHCMQNFTYIKHCMQN